MRNFVLFILLYSSLVVIKLNLIEDQLLVLVNFKTEHFKIEVEIWYWVACRLILWEVQPSHILVL